MCKFNTAVLILSVHVLMCESIERAKHVQKALACIVCLIQVCAECKHVKRAFCAKALTLWYAKMKIMRGLLKQSIKRTQLAKAERACAFW